jgi:myb proto-oncogene protein
MPCSAYYDEFHGLVCPALTDWRVTALWGASASANCLLRTWELYVAPHSKPLNPQPHTQNKQDALLLRCVARHGPKNWSAIAHSIPGRSGKSCRLRWLNQLNPNVKKEPFSGEEDAIIMAAHQLLGNKWASISKLLIGRCAIRGYLWGVVNFSSGGVVSTLQRTRVSVGQNQNRSTNPKQTQNQKLKQTNAAPITRSKTTGTRR